MQVSIDTQCFEYDEHAKPPLVNSHQIHFNGQGDEGHETFYIPRKRDPDNPFTFCKTAQKNYDLYVTAILCIMEHIAPDAINVRSDGDPADWIEGLALAREFIPAVNLPRGVMI